MPSRRAEVAMTPEEIDVYLTREHRVILTSNGPDGYPHPMPMNFVYRDGVYLMTTFRKSQKVINLRRDARVALLVESGRHYTELASVLAYADAEIVDDLPTTVGVLEAIARKEGAGAGPLPDDVQAMVTQSAPKRVTLRFAPRSFVSWDHRKLGGRY